jgi:uncharacterized RDD family membrane protein YckC
MAEAFFSHYLLPHPKGVHCANAANFHAAKEDPMNWYYADGGRQAGPVEEAALDELVRQGVVRDDTLVWREGLASWQPHGVVRPRPAAPPPPAPPIPAPPMAPPPPAAEVRYCAECGRPYQAYELSMVGSVAVCSMCRPTVMQRMNPNPFQPAAQPFNQPFMQPVMAGGRRYAGFWIRFVARFIDGILVGIVSFVILIPLTFLGIGGASMLNTRDPATALAALPALMGVIGISFILRIALFAAYEIYFVSSRGATPGKMALGLKVIRADGGPVSAGLATGRFFGLFLSGIILYIGYIMAGFDPEKRALHDRLCETRVIYSR